MSNREISLLVWLGLGILFAVSKADIRRSIYPVLRGFASHKIWLPLTLYILYIGGCAFVLRRIGAWEASQWFDTVAWILLAGFPLLFKVKEASTQPKFFRIEAAQVFGLGLILEVLLGQHSFGLPIELMLVPTVTLLAIAVQFSTTRKENAAAGSVFGCLLAVIVLLVIAFTVQGIYSDLEATDYADAGRDLLFLVVFPLISLPFLYVFALVASYESAFLYMDLAVKPNRASRESKLALIAGLKWNLPEIYAFRWGAARNVTSAQDFSLALAEVRKYCQTRAEDDLEKSRDELRFLSNIGRSGADDGGKQWDQREFSETRAALRWLATCQMGWYRREPEGYKRDLLDFVGDFTGHGLPEDSGINLQVSDDGNSWLAWRRTISGWYMAIGAAKSPPDQWSYDGPEPPTGFPGQDDCWGQQYSSEAAPNWD